MSSHHYTISKCFSCDLCNNENRQLLPDHICTACGKILHLLRGIGVQEEDTVVCQLCYNENKSIIEGSCNMNVPINNDINLREKINK